MYQNLVVNAGVAGARESVHLEDWPDVDAMRVDERLSRKIEVAREIVSLGLRARMDAKVKVRQPLRTATLVLNDDRDADLAASSVEAIREELNVLAVKLGTAEDSREFGTIRYKPNFRSLGQRGLGKTAQDLKKALASDADALAAMMKAHKQGRAMWRDQEILRDDVEVTFEPGTGFAASADRVGSVFLDTKLDEKLRNLGLLRELQNRLQNVRKEMGLEYTDRIRVALYGTERVVALVRAHEGALRAELLADIIDANVGVSPHAAEFREIEVEGERIYIAVLRV
jgi:isoleucyl-tRNA synthetase